MLQSKLISYQNDNVKCCIRSAQIQQHSQVQPNGGHLTYWWASNILAQNHNFIYWSSCAAHATVFAE